MKKLMLMLTLVLMPLTAWGAVESRMSVDVDPNDKPSLQRGAKLFANYCMACHEASLIRYNRIGQDLGIDDDLVEQYLIFKPETQIQEQMTNAMSESDAENWFGVPAPDLSLTARRHGPDYIYTFLNRFYVDEGTITGFNNTVIGGTAMPHVLETLQGRQHPVYEERDGEDVLVGFEVEEGTGTMDESEYRQATRDLTNFLDYVAEPIKAERQRLGVWVLLFFGVFTVLAYFLKKEYWKDVH
ncbi:cytochrome c1 [Aquisalimonas sp.]|uniref:cytochrome c1 n=1 Tax=unclassified Aquisalimonas TaxID=2644645 RepID=UPI0025BF85D0|nr:cytochrome c1 [Aquisalimonas sp.]